jgi:hypothetical protein
MTTPSHPDPFSGRGPDGGPADVDRDFWGDAEQWAGRSAEARPARRRLGATVGRWWNSTGSMPITRTHGAPPREHPAAPIDDTDPVTGDGWPTDDWSADDWLTDDGVMEDWAVEDWHDGADSATEPEHAATRSVPEVDDREPSGDHRRPGSRASGPGVDPLLARLGGLAIVLTLLVPVILGFTSGDDDGDTLRTSNPVPQDQPITPPTTAPLAATPTAPAVTTATPTTVGTDAPAAPPSTATGAGTTAVTQDDVQPVDAAAATSTSEVAAAAALATDSCSLEYEVAAGDFWIRIAEGSGAPLADVLAANSATVSTPLYPGRTICLPAGATTPPPPPPPTTPPTTPAVPSPTVRPATPATTAPSRPAPTTTPTLPPTSNASAAEVQAIIRAIWPDELEERALEVAWRESNHRPTAKNFCCYGVFQIYWNVHKGWLPSLGITSPEQLYDPTLNTRAALALYERSGGWGPWGG